MVSLFTRTIKNILSNYIAHETIICDGKDHGSKHSNPIQTQKITGQY